uniref:PCI domain-containing protein n=1 Tax=Romanomermis culicivorax TaxID=13658 RepID=A0A915KKU2_ROMCU
MDKEKIKKSSVVFNEISDGRIVKMEIDCSEKVDRVVPIAEKLAKSGSLQKALDELYLIEKESRIACDMRSNTKIQLCIVKLCFESKNYNILRDNIVALTKKRSLIKQSITEMIRECCTYVDKITDKDEKLKLIETIRTVTDGKIYVESERARLTSKLAKMLEKDGKLDEATKCLLELQIETFGSMEKQEKVEILLEQIRLCLLRQDYIRAQIISKKISTRFFEDKTNKENQLLKLKYYELMVKLDQNEENYLAISRHFLAVANTIIIENDEAKLNEAMRNAVLYLILQPFTNEQSDAMYRLQENKNLANVPEYKNLLNLFIQPEVISWKNDIVEKNENLLRKGTALSPATDVFKADNEIGKKQWENFKIRVVEHNIRMVAKYYSKISMQRLAKLLDYDKEKTEEFLCQLIVSGMIENAKIDRSAGVITFRPRKLAHETLDEWNENVREMMDKMNRACHLIAKEEMVHKHLKPTPVL